METLHIEGTYRTPTISLNPDDGILKIMGRSNPENAREFYTPVLNWLDEYITLPAERTDLRVNLEHFNTSSSKFLMEIFRRIRYLADKDKAFNVKWLYEEDDLEMLDTAEAYEMMTGLRFEKISYPEGETPDI
ncbi:MAG: DUF1987 domain-containing protein [Bacteroidales bacterium]|nr:DUF1987 domain-containing protein [Bacteroidales bacterium]